MEPGTASLARDPDPTQSLDKDPENGYGSPSLKVLSSVKRKC